MSGLEVLQNDAGILEGLLKKTCPPVYRHLQKHKVEPLLYMTDWFLCAMTRTLPWDTLLRVWDCFLAEGIRVIFKVALVILGASLNSHKVRKQCNGLCETLEVLRNPPEEVLDEDFIINHMQSLNLRVEDFQLEHTRQKSRRAKQKALQEAKAAAAAAQSSSSNTSTYTRPLRSISPTTTVTCSSGNITVVNIGGPMDNVSQNGTSSTSYQNGGGGAAGVGSSAAGASEANGGAGATSHASKHNSVY